jgi:hypothetical protein
VIVSALSYGRPFHLGENNFRISLSISQASSFAAVSSNLTATCNKR